MPSPPSCRLGILRLADRFTLLPSEAIRYGPGPRLRLPRPHLTVGALPSMSREWRMTHCPLSPWVGAHPPWPTGFNPAFGYEYRLTTAQGDSHSYVKMPYRALELVSGAKLAPQGRLRKAQGASPGNKHSNKGSPEGAMQLVPVPKRRLMTSIYLELRSNSLRRPFRAFRNLALEPRACALGCPAGPLRGPWFRARN